MNDVKVGNAYSTRHNGSNNALRVLAVTIPDVKEVAHVTYEYHYTRSDGTVCLHKVGTRTIADFVENLMIQGYKLVDGEV